MQSPINTFTMWNYNSGFFVEIDKRYCEEFITLRKIDQVLLEPKRPLALFHTADDEIRKLSRSME